MSLVVASAVALAACVSPVAAPAAPGALDVRVLVELVQPSDDGAAIAAAATRLSGVPVRYAAAVSPLRHALVLQCASAIACEGALQSLRAASGVYKEVAPDEKMRAMKAAPA